MTRRQVLSALVLFAGTATIVSFTIGRDLVAGRTPDLLSFVLVNFAGYLFFVALPVEALVPWYVLEGYDPALLAGLAVATGVAAQGVDYGIGALVRRPVVRHLIGEERLERTRGTINRWGGWAVLLTNLSPFTPPTVAVAGVVRLGLARSLAWAGLGLAIKYTVLAVVFRGL